MDSFERVVQQPNGSIDAAKSLINQYGIDVNKYLTSGVVGATSLWVAARHNHHGMVKLLLENGANPNKRCENKAVCHEEAPIHIATGHNHIETLKLLLGYEGTDVNIVMEEEVTPIFLALQEGNLEALILLLEAGANINTIRSDGTPGIFMAAQNNRTNILEWLVVNNTEIDFNLRDNNGITPFLQTIRMEVKDSFNILCGAKGVDMTIPDNDGLSPLDHSVKEGLFDLTYAMTNHGLNLTYDHLNQIKQIVSMWRWIDRKAMNQEDIGTIENILLRVTNPLIYKDALNPFIIEADKYDILWATAVEKCKYWLPVKSFHTRFSSDQKKRIETFVLCINRIGTTLWMRIPRPLVYKMIEIFMKPNPLKRVCELDSSDDTIDYSEE